MIAARRNLAGNATLLTACKRNSITARRVRQLGGVDALSCEKDGFALGAPFARLNQVSLRRLSTAQRPWNWLRPVRDAYVHETLAEPSRRLSGVAQLRGSKDVADIARPAGAPLSCVSLSISFTLSGVRTGLICIACQSPSKKDHS